MIRALTCRDLPALVLHLRRHLVENEAELFMVPQSVDNAADTYVTSWISDPSVASGEHQHLWGVFDGADLRAHIVVTGNPMAVHRCSLAMGVERSHRGVGLGRRLMQTALDWVRAQPSLDWVDGMAFANNTPVLNLDKSVGFFECGHIPDVLRANGRSVAQLNLVLKVR